MAVLEKAVPKERWTRRLAAKTAPLQGAFFWLSAFYVVYCARPEDWIPGLKYLPLAKISGIFRIIGLLMSAGKSKRSLRDLPKEANYLGAMIGLLIAAALLSPVWKGGAFFKTLDFAKVLIAWVLTFVVITNFERLKKNHFYPVGFGGGDCSGLFDQRTVPSPSGGRDWRNLLQSQRPGVRDRAFAAVLRGLHAAVAQRSHQAGLDFLDASHVRGIIHDGLARRVRDFGGDGYGRACGISE